MQGGLIESPGKVGASDVGYAGGHIESPGKVGNSDVGYAGRAH